MSEAMDKLLAIMARLRDPERGCPWDLEQDFSSIAPYTLEEAHEVADAIARGDMRNLEEELGDLLLQVVFHAQMASEQELFRFEDVARGIADKLVRRHPHVFAGLDVADADEVERNWEAIKAQEKQRTGPTEGIPASLPALAYADKVLGRLQRSGDVELPAGDGLGARLLALVAEAREQGLDPERELRVAVRNLVQGG